MRPIKREVRTTIARQDEGVGGCQGRSSLALPKDPLCYYSGLGIQHVPGTCPEGPAEDQFGWRGTSCVPYGVVSGQYHSARCRAVFKGRDGATCARQSDQRVQHKLRWGPSRNTAGPTDEWLFGQQGHTSTPVRGDPDADAKCVGICQNAGGARGFPRSGSWPERLQHTPRQAAPAEAISE